MSTHRRHWPQYIGAFILMAALAGTATAYSAIEAVKPPDMGTGLANVFPGVPPGDHNWIDDVKAGQPQTLLLIGSDKRSKRSADGSVRTGQLSDTIMLAHIDPARPTTLLSIPRDTQVTVPQKDGSVFTEKINAAFEQGGAPLTVKVVRNLLRVPINHVVVTDFSAFQRAVNRLGCLYEDIDRSYFNDNSAGQNYATIDVKSGYQLLCGADTLDWVRFRHTDSDLVRAARQQAFLRAAKNQVAASKLFKSRNDLINIFSHYTATDIQSSAAVIGILKLILDASGQPIRSVGFRATDQAGNTNLLVSGSDLALMRKEFLEAAPVTKALPSEPKNQAAKAKKATTKRRGLATGLVKVADETTSQSLVKASFDLAGGDPLPVYYPSARLATGGYADLDPVRTYAIKPGRYSKRSYPAFRLTYSAGQGSYLGQYYGLQGTTWKDAPILEQTHHAVRRGGRTLQVYPAGARTQLVAWQTPRAVYWLSNTVSLSLSNAQMLDIAASLKRVPG